jgi:hypothetical protein
MCNRNKMNTVPFFIHLFSYLKTVTNPNYMTDQWLGDQQPMSWKGEERNRFFPHPMYCPSICPETEQTTTKPSDTIVGVLTKRRSMVSPKYKSET